MAGVAVTVSKVLQSYRGAIVGALIGDCLGAPYEGGSPDLEDILQDLQHLEDGRKDKKKLSYTDDTAMLRSVAKSLIEHRKLEITDLAKRFVSEYFMEPFRGYGGNVVNVFKMLKKSNCSDALLPASQQFNGSGSYGNGGAMRVAPVALFGYHSSDEELRELVTGVTSITHTNVNAINGAILECCAVREALKYNVDATAASSNASTFLPLDFDTFLDSLQNTMESLELGNANLTDQEKIDRTDADDESRPYCQKLFKIRSLLKSVGAEDHSTEDVVQELGNDISALGSVPAALYCFLHSLKPIPGIPDQYNAFEQTIIYAISLGGDTDTIATMAGAIAGAFYGIDMIPEKWSVACEALDEALEMANSLYDIGFERK